MHKPLNICAIASTLLAVGACSDPAIPLLDSGPVSDIGVAATKLTLLFTGNVAGNIEPCG